MPLWVLASSAILVLSAKLGRTPASLALATINCMRRYLILIIIAFSNFLLFGQELLNRKLYEAAQNAAKTDEIDELITYFEGEAETKEDLVLLISYWMMNNINYDVEGFSTNNYQSSSWETTLTSGVAVCSGYATLFKEFCNRVSIKCEIVDGFAKGYGYTAAEKFNEPNHAWNIVKIDNQYHLFDITWASGYIQRIQDTLKYFKFPEPSYLFSPPNIFIEKHLPSQKRWQLLENPVSFERFSKFEWYEQMKDSLSNFYNYQDSIKNFLTQSFIDQQIMNAEESFSVFPSESELARNYERIAYQLSNFPLTKEKLEKSKYYYSSALELFTDSEDKKRCEKGIEYTQYYLNKM